MAMKITDFLKQDGFLCLDGGMGTLLQGEGLMPGELPERWCISHPEVITGIHRAYYDAGSNVVNTNTFGANALKLEEAELEEIVRCAIQCARKAQQETSGTQPTWVALDIGPLGRMLSPLGDLDFEDAVEIFAKTVRLGVRYGADLVMIETMNDSYETKAALLAVKENSTLPVFVSNAYGEDGKLMTGASPAAMVALLEGMGADAIGVNCSLGPQALAPVVEEYLTYASLPVLLKPNAGLPRMENGKTVFDVSPADFAREVASLAARGVRIVGGCCGTTPAYISETVRAMKDITPVAIEKKTHTLVSSYTHTVVFDREPVLIGERINPTGKKRFKEALKANDVDYILGEGLAQAERGVHILDVNVGLPEINEPEMLARVVRKLQEVTDLPLQIDSSDPLAMEAALRVYNGKAMINSVSGKEESMRAVFPLQKKYGGLIVALTLDESGIPTSAEGRVTIARRILARAAEYGIDKKDIIFDPLALTVSADGSAAVATLDALAMIRRELGCHTSLGVSNVSFGLPARDMINGTFFSMALCRGLSAAIMNPYSAEMMKTYHAYRALCGMDENCRDYIAFAETVAPVAVATPAGSTATDPVSATQGTSTSDLALAIAKGRTERAAALTEAAIANGGDPMALVQGEIIPALDTVGVGFENKTMYLPQLLMSAEAAKAAFEVIKASVSASGNSSKCAVVLATVKGDIHDIGKNIVKLLLENYGFEVCDLGRDVPSEAVLEAVLKTKAPLAALSALMTTTVPAMEETIRLLRREAPFCRVMVGGAVLNRDYANAIGADLYAKDAMEAVRCAEEVFAGIDK